MTYMMKSLPCNFLDAVDFNNLLLLQYLITLLLLLRIAAVFLVGTYMASLVSRDGFNNVEKVLGRYYLVE